MSDVYSRICGMVYGLMNFIGWYIETRHVAYDFVRCYIETRHVAYDFVRCYIETRHVAYNSLDVI